MHHSWIPLLLVLALSGSAGAQGRANVARGAEVYAEQKCAACHSIDGQGNRNGPLDDVGRRLTAEEIRLWLTDPRAMTEKTKATRMPPMPAYTNLSKEDLEALVAYMQSLQKDS
jgi:mono/diheme cytochrome c family protein